MFDDAGGPLEPLAAHRQAANEYEADLERSQEMCANPRDYAFWSPSRCKAVAERRRRDESGRHVIAVEEKKLEFLRRRAARRNLIKKGIMGRIYAHLLSLDNFARLLKRKSGAAGLPDGRSVSPESQRAQPVADPPIASRAAALRTRSITQSQPSSARRPAYECRGA